MKTPTTTANQDPARIIRDGLAAALRILDIRLHDDPPAVRAKILRLRTDASAWIEPRDPRAAAAVKLYLALADPDDRAHTMDAYTRGAIGNRDLKNRIADTVASALESAG